MFQIDPNSAAIILLAIEKLLEVHWYEVELTSAKLVPWEAAEAPEPQVDNTCLELEKHIYIYV